MSEPIEMTEIELEDLMKSKPGYVWHNLRVVSDGMEENILLYAPVDYIEKNPLKFTETPGQHESKN